MTVATTPNPTIAAAWAARAPELAQRALGLAQRLDRWGQYRKLNERERLGKLYTAVGRLTAEILQKHFRGVDQGDIIGFSIW